MTPSHRIATFLRALIALALLLTFVPSARPAAAAAQIQATGSQPVKKFNLFKDIYTANRSSDPDAFFGIGSRFLFNADNGQASSLWASNGTSTGTVHLADINGYHKVIYNGKTYFAGNTTTGSQGVTSLWVTDGTPQGTRVLKDFSPSGFDIYDMVEFGGWLYFSAELNDPETGASDVFLWRTDGTEENTKQVSNLSLNDISGNSGELEVANNALYFEADDGQSGFELYRLAAPGGQPALVRDLCPDTCKIGMAGSSPHSLKAVGNRLFFLASDLAHGLALWVSDGTSGGTQMVFDVADEEVIGQISHLTAVGNWLYFTAYESATGERLYGTDGTQANTAPFNGYKLPEENLSSPLVSMNGALYFTADDGQHGFELWKILPGPQATPQLIDILPGAAGSIPSWLTPAGQGNSAVLYFAAQDAPGNRELWRSGGTAATTQLVKDLVPGPEGGWPSDLAAWNNGVVFSAIDSAHNREPWVSDGTAAGTHLVADLNTQVYQDGSTPGGFKTFNGITYFTATDPLQGTELWRTDNTPQGTFALGDFAPGPISGSTTNDMAELNGVVYFAAPEGIYAGSAAVSEASDGYGSELWRSDGTREGTWRVKDIRNGPAGSYPEKFTRAGDDIYFFAEDGVRGRALWKTDGTTDGTVMVSNAMPFPEPPDPYYYTPTSYPLAALGSMVIFTVPADETAPFGRLWRSNGTSAGTVPFYDNGAINFNLIKPVEWNNRLYLGLLIGMAEARLYVTDGTGAGTHEILTPGGPDTYDVVAQAVLGGSLYFTTASPAAYSPPDEITTGLWKLAPGATSAVRILDFPHANIDLLTPDGDSQLFFQVSSDAGKVWWTSDGTTSGTREICPSCVYTASADSTIFQGKMYFIADSGTGPEIWVTDGAESGTRSLFASQPNLKLTQISQLSSNGKVIYFDAQDETHGAELWTYTEMYEHYLPMVKK